MTPTPVIIQNWPGPDSVAWITLGVAIATLLAVGFQIFLAQKELHYVKQDLENNTAQFKEFLRRPDLRATVTQHNTLPPNDDSWIHSELTINVFNHGGRLTRQFLCEVLVPTSALANPPQFVSPFVREVEHSDYMVYQLPSSDVVFPNRMPKEIPRCNFGLNPRVGEFIALWRIYDDAGNYPKDTWGQWTLNATVNA